VGTLPELCRRLIDYAVAKFRRRRGDRGAQTVLARLARKSARRSVLLQACNPARDRARFLRGAGGARA
jgi:hypothetical protein